MLDGLKDKCSVAAIFFSRLFGPTKQNLRNTSGVTALCKTANFWPVKLFPDGVHKTPSWRDRPRKKGRTLLANSKDIRRYPISVSFEVDWRYFDRGRKSNRDEEKLTSRYLHSLVQSRFDGCQVSSSDFLELLALLLLLRDLLRPCCHRLLRFVRVATLIHCEIFRFRVLEQENSDACYKEVKFSKSKNIFLSYLILSMYKPNIKWDKKVKFSTLRVKECLFNSITTRRILWNKIKKETLYLLLKSKIIKSESSSIIYNVTSCHSWVKGISSNPVVRCKCT